MLRLHGTKQPTTEITILIINSALLTIVRPLKAMPLSLVGNRRRVCLSSSKAIVWHSQTKNRDGFDFFPVTCPNNSNKSIRYFKYFSLSVVLGGVITTFDRTRRSQPPLVWTEFIQRRNAGRRQGRQHSNSLLLYNLEESCDYLRVDRFLPFEIDGWVDTWRDRSHGRWQFVTAIVVLS